MSKKFTRPQPTPQNQPPTQPAPQNKISIPDAIMYLNQRITALETFMTNHAKQIETKLGDHENYISENTPDVDLINTVFSDINKRLLEVEGLEERVSKLESNTESDSPKTSLPSKPTKKKGGTIKLDMDQKLQNPTENVGISFS